jgi:class 3 adenylate cyclase
VSLGRHAPRIPAPPPPSRRPVAVLFADLSGFTDLVESAEPETVYEIVRPQLDALAFLVQLHGGEIQQVLGDGFMCAFGLYETRGDEAERAVTCALAMVDVPRGGLPVHVGVEYGEVLVTPTWNSAAFGVWGRAVNHAQRLCELAGPGELHVGPAAYAYTRHLRPATCIETHLAGVAHRVVVRRMARHDVPSFPACPVA